MKANTKYTALELLKEAKIKNPESKFGKVRIMIAGIAGIIKPDHLIKIQPNTKSIDILIGNENVSLKIDGSEKSSCVSKLAKEILNKQSKKK
jgi:hypothetical protein